MTIIILLIIIGIIIMKIINVCVYIYICIHIHIHMSASDVLRTGILRTHGDKAVRPGTCSVDFFVFTNRSLFFLLIVCCSLVSCRSAWDIVARHTADVSFIHSFSALAQTHASEGRERLHIHVCIYIYIYVYTHVHLSLYIYIYIYICVLYILRVCKVDTGVCLAKGTHAPSSQTPTSVAPNDPYLGGCLDVPVPERSALVKKLGFFSKGKRPRV